MDSQGNKDGAAWGTFTGSDGQAGWPVYDTGIRPPMDMNRIPFPYGFLEMEQLEHRIIYYESSRGCPFPVLTACRPLIRASVSAVWNG